MVDFSVRMKASTQTNYAQKTTMKLDRQLQYDLLKNLADIFPRKLSNLQELAIFENAQEDKIMANIAYLKQHQLLDCIEAQYLGDSLPDFYDLTITHKGLDFLMDDGGISAILNVVTVKLHADSIKALLLHQIANSSSMNEHQRQSLSDRIQQLPAKFSDKLLEKISERAIDALFSYSSDIYHSLDTILVSMNQ